MVKNDRLQSAFEVGQYCDGTIALQLREAYLQALGHLSASTAETQLHNYKRTYVLNIIANKIK